MIIGNGICDYLNNNPNCNFDGGDCYSATEFVYIKVHDLLLGTYSFFLIWYWNLCIDKLCSQSSDIAFCSLYCCSPNSDVSICSFCQFLTENNYVTPQTTSEWLGNSKGST